MQLEFPILGHTPAAAGRQRSIPSDDAVPLVGDRVHFGQSLRAAKPFKRGVYMPNERRKAARELRQLQRRAAHAPHGQKRAREQELQAWVHRGLRQVVEQRQ